MLCYPWKLCWVCFRWYHSERVGGERVETKVRKIIRKPHRRSFSHKSRENSQSGNYGIKDDRLRLRRKETVLSPGYTFTGDKRCPSQAKRIKDETRRGTSKQCRLDYKTDKLEKLFLLIMKWYVFVLWEKRGRRDYSEERQIQEEGCDYRTRKVAREKTDYRKRRKERGRRAQEKRGSHLTVFFSLR